jgi:hypothetical protein
VVLGPSLVNLGAVECHEGLNSHGLTHLSVGAYPLWENFHNGEDFPLFIPPVLGGSSLRLVLGTLFL